MYWQYVKERLDLEVLVEPEGFALFKVLPEGLYLQEIYVKPEFRLGGAGRRLLGKVESGAQALGIKKIIGSCVPSSNGADASLRAILACGFKLVSCDKDIIYLTKDI